MAFVLVTVSVDCYLPHPGYVMNEPLSRLIGIDYGTFGRVFRWDLTPEGRPYWKDIADKWCRLFQN